VKTGEKATPYGWSPDGTLALLGHFQCESQDAELHGWKGPVDVVDFATGKIVGTAPGVRGEMAFSPDGAELAAQSDADLNVVDLAGGTVETVPGARFLAGSTPRVFTPQRHPEWSSWISMSGLPSGEPGQRVAGGIANRSPSASGHDRRGPADRRRRRKHASGSLVGRPDRGDVPIHDRSRQLVAAAGLVVAGRTHAGPEVGRRPVAGSPVGRSDEAGLAGLAARRRAWGMRERIPPRRGG